MVTNLLKKWYGDFSKDELKKYLLLGFTFALIIGIYWTLRPLKDAIFKSLVIGEGGGAEKTMLAWAKIVSLCVLLPIVVLYSKLVDMLKRHQLFYLLSAIYGCALLVFAYLFAHPQIGLVNHEASQWRILGWAWYVFVESYGSLIVALFWAFTADICDPNSARRGYPLVVMIGQLGGIFGPQLTKLPAYFNFETTAPLVAFCGLVVLSVIGMIYYFMATTPADQLAGFKAQKNTVHEEKEPGFFEGLKLIFNHKYLAGIFAIIIIYEVVVTIFDFNFKGMVFAANVGDKATAAYLGDYATMVNLVSFLCLVFGISNIQRRLGMSASLGLMPFIIGAMVFAFKAAPTIDVLFWIMVIGKAINYALNGPSMKQLYIPTSEDAKYKSQAWIEMFGSRGAKAGGSYFNTALAPLQKMYGLADGFSMYVTIACTFSAGLLVVWFFAALYLAKQYNRAIDENRVVC